METKKDLKAKLTATQERLKKFKDAAAHLQKLKELRELVKTKLSGVGGKVTTTDKKKLDYPVNTSNIFEVKAYLDAWLQNNSNFINIHLQLLWSKIRYFQNLLKFSGDEFLELYGHRIVQTAIVSGAAAIVGGVAEDEKMILGCSPQIIDHLGNIEKAKVFIAPWFQGTGTQTLLKRFNGKTVTKSGIEKQQGKYNLVVFYKFESIGITYLLMLLPMLSILKDIFTMFQINLPHGLYRFMYRYDEDVDEAVVDELSQLINDRFANLWIFKKRSADNDVIAVNNNASTKLTNSPNQFVKEDFAWIQNFMSYLTGEFTNLSEKNERNINAEVQVNTSYFSITQQEYLREAKIFCYHYNKVFNASADVQFTYDIKSEATDDNYQSDSNAADRDDDQSPAD